MEMLEQNRKKIIRKPILQSLQWTKLVTIAQTPGPSCEL